MTIEQLLNVVLLTVKQMSAVEKAEVRKALEREFLRSNDRIKLN